jgi:hypothetical protein
MRAKAPTFPRKLFWRYKANHQRAARDGDWKILKINDNAFLFDVAADPMERANLMARHREIFARLAQEWDAWNDTMLPEVKESNTGGVTADMQADHIGAIRPSPEPDTAKGWPSAAVPSR